MRTVLMGRQDTGILKFVVKVQSSRGAHAHFKIRSGRQFEFYGFTLPTKMPNPYSLDLRWRIVWSYLAHKRSYSEIAMLFSVSERTVRRYIGRFQTTGDVVPCKRRHGPTLLLGEFEQMMMFRMILDKPGIYLSEIQDELMRVFGVYVCVSTICRTLKIMGCTRQAMHRVALQRSDEQRARFMAEISLYDVSMLV